MRLILYILFGFTLLFLMGCKSSSNNASENSNKAYIGEVNSEANIESYNTGIITQNPESNCPYILTDLQSEITYDPINFTDSKFKEFHNKNSKVYFKYHGLRRPNRCPNLLPINLLEIEKRSD